MARIKLMVVMMTRMVMVMLMARIKFMVVMLMGMVKQAIKKVISLLLVTTKHCLVENLSVCSL